MEVSSQTAPGRGGMVAVWISRLVVVGILAMGAIPKFTGGAGALAEKLPGGMGAVTAIGVMEILAIVLMLVPKTSLYGAALATVLMLGAVTSHIVGPVGLSGDFASMFAMALVALIAAATTLTLQLRSRRVRGVGA